jgi:hypothetical protein
MLSSPRKRSLASACAVLVLAVASNGPVNAQTATPQAPAEQSAEPGEHHHGHEMFAIAAQAIGITPQQLRQELPGKSLAMVAEAHGKNPADVANALKTASNAHIDQAMNHVWPVDGAEKEEAPETSGTSTS